MFQIQDKAQRVIFRIISFISAAYLCYYYRQGGIKDVGITEPGLRDVGVYVEAGKAVFAGLNPYETVGNRFGTLGPLPITLLSYLVPSEFLTFFFQAINLMGIYLFLFVFVRLYKNQLADPIFLTILFFAPTREMLTTNQITGIIMGLIAFGYLMYARYLEQKSFADLVISGVSFAFAADLKPHLVALFILFLSVSNRKLNVLFASLASWSLGHLAIDISQGRILEIDWLASLQVIQYRSSQGTLGDSVSFWPIIYKLLGVDGLPGTVTNLPLFLTTIFALRYCIKSDLARALPWVFLIPSTSIYFHYYDAIPAFLIALLLIKDRVKIPALVFIGLTLIPKEYQSIRNQILVILFLSLWTYFSMNPRKIGKIVLAFLLVNAIHFMNNQITDDKYFMQTLVVSESLILCALTLITLTRNSNFLQGFKNFIDNSKAPA